jgi:hypothetical protein
VIDIWYAFWMFSFVLAGTAFAAIAVVVTIRGIGELREMLDDLRTRQRR